MLIEQCAQFVTSLRRLAKQPSVANFLDIIGFQVDINRKAVFELEQLRRVERGARIVLGQGLLRSTDDPDLAIPQLLEVFCQAIEVENKVGTRADILAHLVDDENDVFLA
ncbi:hypothetical protein D9M73_197060 [compost metagenome]